MYRRSPARHVPNYTQMNYVTKQYPINMKLPLVSLLLLVLLTCCHGNKSEDSEAYLSHFIADLWLEGADILKIIWKDCSKKLVDVKEAIDRKEYFPKFIRCMKRKTLKVLDRSLSSDIVPIAEGVNLVRFELVDGSGNTMLINNTSSWTEKELEEGEWRSLALQRIAQILRTHVVKFDFGDTKIFEKVESRGRRRHHLMTMMMFGIVSIGMVLVPMGFQFLAVLGGKALILAKMALILASIQGLKKVDTSFDGYERGKIASSPLNYGFYHSYPYEHFEKRSLDDSPALNIITPTPQPQMTIQSPWPNSDKGHPKLDKLQKQFNHVKPNIMKRKIDVTWRSDNIKEVVQYPEAKVFPVYPGTLPTVLSTVDVSSPVVDITTSPGEVQADYALELPYNGLRFQSPTAVV